MPMETLVISREAQEANQDTSIDPFIGPRPQLKTLTLSAFRLTSPEDLSYLK